MGILAQLTGDERAEIAELQKALTRNTAEREAAAKRVADEETLINAFVVRVRRKYGLVDGDQIRVEFGDIVRPDGGVIAAPVGPSLADGGQ